MNILRKIVGRVDDVGRGAGIERRESADLPRGARTRQLGGADRVIVEIIFGRALAKGGCRRQVGTAQIHADERLKAVHVRSEEHTSELQSLMRISYAVFCLKKKKNNNI